MSAPRILYCHCQYAQVVPPAVKQAVLRHLCETGTAFDAVADLCEMSARKDAALPRLAAGEVKIAACFPRAVKGLFHNAQADLSPDSSEIINMRTLTADEVISRLCAPLAPNLPTRQSATPAPAPPQPAEAA
jgi:hypothetical protein